MFTQFYAATVCAPSRASLLTGKMPNRMGFWDAYAFVETTYEKTGKTVPNPDFDPQGELPYGAYVPLEQLKASLAEMAIE